MKYSLILLTVLITGCTSLSDPRCGGDHRCNYLISQGYTPQGTVTMHSPQISTTQELLWSTPTGRTFTTRAQ